ncbi:MAG: hypothetical protein Q7S27_01265 [Nanoarchaeota archaeon]|nr:hypothetical protein [Nanoarchaeota archaeon]
MQILRNYQKDARENEEVFRNILREYVEKIGLDPKAPLEEIFRKYSNSSKSNKWKILDFRRGPYKDKDHEFELERNMAMLCCYPSTFFQIEEAIERSVFIIGINNSVNRFYCLETGYSKFEIYRTFHKI